MNTLPNSMINEITHYLTPKELLIFTTTTKKHIEWCKPIYTIRIKIISILSAKLLNTSWFSSSTIQTKNEATIYECLKEDIDSYDEPPLSQNEHAEKKRYIFNTIDMYADKLMYRNNMHTSLSCYGITKRNTSKVKKCVFYNKTYENIYIHRIYRIPREQFNFYLRAYWHKMNDTGFREEQCLNIRALIY